jgi:phospholipid/cholesterol/gamma-HCH transport system ATP-binding protein
MIKFTGVTNRYFTDVSFELTSGTVCKIIANSDLEKNMLLDTIFGLVSPDRGEVLLFGERLDSISEERAIALFKKVGVVWEDGGAISNLKVWENIMLPGWYHKGLKAGEVEERVVESLVELGIEEDVLSDFLEGLPGNLPVYELRIICMVRAMLMEPELMIFDSVFDGLSPHVAEKVASMADKFYHAREGRAAVFISSDEQSMKHINEDVLLRQHGRGFES